MRILIVDDESLNRFLLMHMLEQEGYQDCYEASNGAQALEMASELNPDLVLLDVIMPDISGYEVAPRLKALSSNNYLPIIFITSLEDRASLVRCLEVGGDDFVAKPFDRLVLAAKIRAHGRIRSLNQRIEDQNKTLLQHQQIMAQEHDIVEHIFKNAIRHNPEMAARFDYKLTPAAQFNGDVFLTESSPAGGAYYLIGDFTGHGLASAIGVLPVARAFQIMAIKGLSVSEMARTINATLLQLLPGNMFFAAIIAEIDADGCQHHIWHGGMPQLMRKRARDNHIETLCPAHMALGILGEDEFESHCITLKCDPGDTLLLYTDGLIEVCNDQGEMLNEEGVKQWFEQPGISADQLYRQAREYMGADNPADDMTIVIYTCTAFSQSTAALYRPALPLTVSMQLQNAQLQDTEVITRFVDTICVDPAMTAVRSNLFTVLSELFNNALEHGVLQLDSGLKATEEGFLEYYQLRETRLRALQQAHITIGYHYNPNDKGITLTVADSGNGFDINALQGHGEDDCYGRGLSLVQDICQQLTYYEGGRKVCAVLPMPWPMND